MAIGGGLFDKNFGGILGGGCGGGCGGGWDQCGSRNRCDDPKKGCFITAVRAGCFNGDFDTDKWWL